MNKQIKNPAVWMPLVIAVTLAAGMWLGKIFFTSGSRWDANAKLDMILKMIDANYVDDIDTDSLFDSAIPELLSHLDPHSTYIPASDLQSVNDELEGSFSGIGISFTLMNDTINVLEVIAGGPSEKVGLLAGDRIVSINDSIVASRGWTNEQVMKNLRGEKGTTVKLGIKRNTSPKLLTYEVTRGDIPVNSVDASYLIDDKTGYMKINKFGNTTYNEFLNGMLKMKAEGAERFIIDLRGNGGGFMEPAVFMAQEFLAADAPIVSMKGKVKSNNGILTADGSGSFQNEQIVVLLDEYSASASEIFAGAIQDNDRGLVVGRRSFGKGLVQHQTELPDSSAIRLTVARYYTPSGRCIQKTYAPGTNYNNDIIDRYYHGEFYNADSIKQNTNLAFTTANGRTVYGGGGIMPDIFVPNDTTGYTSYYLNVANAGLLQKFAFDFNDRNRAALSSVKNSTEFLRALPDDEQLLQSFVNYAAGKGVAPRWFYINRSRSLLLSTLKALIARDAIGLSGYYEVNNLTDPTVRKALDAIKGGEAKFPVTVSAVK